MVDPRQVAARILADNLRRVYTMLSLLLFLTVAPLAVNAEPAAAPVGLVPAEPLAGMPDERDDHFVPGSRERSKKELWLLEKARRPDVHTADAGLPPFRPRGKTSAKQAPTGEREAEARLAQSLPPVGSRVEPVTTLYNLWNREALPLLAGRPYKRPFQLFLRDHYTKESTFADPRLAAILVAAALHFHASRVEVVSGYRSPKYNLMLRKKGHQVARESQHMQGTAVDFRLRGVTTEALRELVRGLHVGGVGYYPRTKFIHADTGKVRSWTGS
jgi:hypothetical protein